MVLQKMVNGELLVMTPQEEAEFLASLPAPVVTVEDYRRAIQGLVDETAQQRSYDSGLTCASYVGSTNPIWAAEAAAFTAWRDAVWIYAYAELAKVETAQRPQPTVAAFLSELPAIAWPA